MLRSWRGFCVERLVSSGLGRLVALPVNDGITVEAIERDRPQGPQRRRRKRVLTNASMCHGFMRQPQGSSPVRKTRAQAPTHDPVTARTALEIGNSSKTGNPHDRDMRARFPRLTRTGTSGTVPPNQRHPERFTPILTAATHQCSGSPQLEQRLRSTFTVLGGSCGRLTRTLH